VPRGDRTGPAGFGPMTGRGLGYCAGNVVPGFMVGPGWGRGWGRGRGGAWGRRWGFRAGYFGPPWGPWTSPGWYPGPGAYPAPYPAYAADLPSEEDVLRREAKALKEQLETVEARLEELRRGDDRDDDDDRQG